MMELNEISELSDKALFKMCQSNGINIGPIGPTTRKLYDRKLFKVLQNKGGDQNPQSSSTKSLAVDNDMVIPLQRKSISQYLGLDETPKSYTKPAPNLSYMNVTDTPRTHRTSGEGDATSTNNHEEDNPSEGEEGSFRLDKISDNESDSERQQLSTSAYMSVTRSGVLKRRPLHQQSLLDDSAFASNDAPPAKDNEYESAALISTKVKLVIVFVVVVFVYLVFESLEPEPTTPKLN